MSIISLSTSGNDITGRWNGVLDVHGMKLTIIINIDKTLDEYAATMESPDQGTMKIPVSSVTFDNNQLQFNIAGIGVEYKGNLDNDSTINGNFRQNGMSFPLTLSRKAVEKKKANRPQEPVKPYSYYEEEVRIENKKANVVLAGTLTLPQKEGNFPAVVLITGSGAQDRNEELMGHKPFLIWADYLTKNGIAVLRFDDRGIASSTGSFENATTFDFSTDVESAVQYLLGRKEINKKEIGLIGHSEGGMIAPMVASRSKNIAFIVLLAGPGIPVEQLLLQQQELIGKVSGMTDSDISKAKEINLGAYEIIKKSTNDNQLKTDLTAYFEQKIEQGSIPEKNKEKYIKTLVAQSSSPWTQYFIKYDPATILKKVKCPVLAVNGEKDLQVSAKENLEGIKSALQKSGNKSVTTIEFPGLNHLFQECKTGSVNEYAEIEQTVSPVVLDTVSQWIKRQIK